MNRFCAISDECGNSIDQQIEALKSVGLNHIELRKINDKYIYEYKKKQIKEIIRKIYNNDIFINVIDTPIGKKRVKSKRLFIKCLKYCTLCNAGYIRIFLDLPNDYLKYFNNKSKKYNVKLLIENEKNTSFTNIKQFVKVKETLRLDNIFILFDVENYFYNNKLNYINDFLDNINLIKHVHLRDYSKKENNYVKLGTGDLKLDLFIKKVYDSEYNGFLSLETHIPIVSSLSKKIILKDNYIFIKKVTR